MKAIGFSWIIMQNRFLEGQGQDPLKYSPSLSSHSGGISHKEVTHSLWTVKHSEEGSSDYCDSTQEEFGA